MKLKIFFLLAFLMRSAIGFSQQKIDFKFQNGDLLFQDLDCGDAGLGPVGRCLAAVLGRLIVSTHAGCEQTRGEPTGGPTHPAA